MRWVLYFMCSSLLLLIVPCVLYGQITVPDEIAPHEPIIAGCNCILPQGGIAEFIWRTDQLSKSAPVENGTKLHVWAGPGSHYIETIVIAYREMMVFVPDPQFPNDPAKAKPEKIRVYINMQRFDKTYKVTGTPTPPPPGPDPPPPPPPPPGPTPAGFAGEVAKMLSALKAASPSAYSKAKALRVGGTFASVAAQAVATQDKYDIIAFVSATKANNESIIPIAERAVWSTHVLAPIAKYQDNLAKMRGIDIFNDEAGLAKIWVETAEAMTEAANSVGANLKVEE